MQRPRSGDPRKHNKQKYFLYYTIKNICRANDLLSRITMGFILMKSRQFFSDNMTNAFYYA